MVTANATGQRIALTASTPLALTENGPILRFSSGGTLGMAKLSLSGSLSSGVRDKYLWPGFQGSSTERPRPLLSNNQLYFLLHEQSPFMTAVPLAELR
jgi:hypothetical protein